MKLHHNKLNTITQCLCIMLLGASSQLQAADYYVDNVAGRDSNSGTKRTPWSSLAYGVERLVAGDVLHIIDNGPQTPYRELIELETSGIRGESIMITGAEGRGKPQIVGSDDWSDRSASGSLAWQESTNSYITLTGQAEPAALFMASVGTWQDQGVHGLSRRQQVDSVSLQQGEWRYAASSRMLKYRLQDGESIGNLHVEAVVKPNLLMVDDIHNIEIKNLGFMFSHGNTAQLESGSSNIRMIDIDITHVEKNAVSVTSGENIVIENCNIRDASNNGIVFGGSMRDKLSNSIVRGCTISEVHNNDCITLHKDTKGYNVGAGFLISNNELSQCAEQGIDVTSGKNVTLAGNTTYDNGESGILLGNNVKNILIKRHLSVGDGKYAGMVIGQSQNVTIAGSCIFSNETHQLVIRDARDIYLDGNVIYQGPGLSGSLIDIADNSYAIDFVNNLTVSEADNDPLLLRYLGGNSPNQISATYHNNTWGAMADSNRPFYTDDINRHNFEKHAQHYRRSPSDTFTSGMTSDNLRAKVDENNCMSDEMKVWLLGSL